MPSRRVLKLRSSNTVWLAWTIGLTVFFVSMAANNLSNYRPVSADEVSIIALSHRLATQGIFGSDLYAGFFNADQHWLLNPPAHFVWQAIGFQIAGAGVAQARWVSLLGSLSIIWSAGWLAYRWHSLGAALLTGLLLIFWQSNLIGLDPGLPLLSVARSARYDIGAVAWMWVSIGLLDQVLRRPRRMTALALGVCSGVAMLTQFFGAFVLPLVASAWLWQRGKCIRTESTPYWMAAGVTLITLPYALYVLPHSADLIGQATLADTANRVQLDQLEFYINNFRNEPSRFMNRQQQSTLSPALLTLGIWPALAYLWHRARRMGALGDRLLWLSLLIFQGLLALLDQSKAPLYAVVLLPSVCMTLAVLWADGLHWAWKQDLPIRLAAGSLMIGLLAILVREGAIAYQVDRQQARSVSSYLEVGRKIDSYLTPEARLLGSDRWWWALRDHPYLSAGGLLAQWRSADLNHDRATQFAYQVAGAEIDFIIVNNNVRGEMSLFAPALQVQFWRFLETCSTLVADWEDASYGRIEIYRVTKAPVAESACR